MDGSLLGSTDISKSKLFSRRRFRRHGFGHIQATLLVPAGPLGQNSFVLHGTSRLTEVLGVHDNRTAKSHGLRAEMGPQDSAIELC